MEARKNSPLHIFYRDYEMHSLTNEQVREIKHACQPHIRRVWLMLAVMATLTISFGLATRAIHVQGREVRNAASSR